ncbi:MAG: pyroglutamyl-peptidase I [Luteimonas sp.]|nr:pyroglutamyl-peptidase I [Luteimonas sp.]
MNHRSSAPRTVLLTGFEPFAGAASNPSWEAVRVLHGRRIAGHRVVARELPVAFGASLATLRAAIRAARPGAVICVGLAAGREAISLERIAINVDDARIPDNAGRQPVDTPVVGGGPDAYFATLPVKAILAALRTAGIPAEVSQTAGTYVCNHVFYGLMHALRRRHGVRAGFIHVPPALDAGARGLPLDTIVDALRIAVRVTLSTDKDARVPAGALD